MLWLDDHVAFFAGAGSGIGRAAVDAFLAEGACVGVFEIDAEKCAELEDLGDRIAVFRGDARSILAQREAVAATVERFGDLDSAASFVGVFDHRRPLTKIDDEDLSAAAEEMFQTNVVSVLATAKASTPHLARTGGALTLTLSTSSFYPGRGGTLYVASKFALRGVVTQLAHELAPRVRVNGVAPGGTLGTDIRGLAALGTSDRRLADEPDRAESMRARTPLEVALTGADHAGAYVYLASPHARGVTGTTIHSDGGIGVRA